MLADPRFSQNHEAEAAAIPSDEGVGATFAIGDLAEQFGITLRALRFYEARGFLSPRRMGSERRYSEDDRDRVALVIQAKRLGFTLREIGEMIAAPERRRGGLLLSRQQCTDQINLLERQKRAIEIALMELRRAYTGHYLRTLGRSEGEGVS